MPKQNSKRQKKEQKKSTPPQTTKNHKFIEAKTTCHKCNQETDQFILCHTNRYTWNDLEQYNDNPEKMNEFKKNLHICLGCAKSCGNCQQLTCGHSYCCRSCEKCGKNVCSDCEVYCPECKTNYCPTCIVSFDKCVEGRCYVCGQIRNNCSECYRELDWHNKMRKCIDCGKDLCHKHYHDCPGRCGAYCITCDHFGPGCFGC